jgi:hypothetical protein
VEIKIKWIKRKQMTHENTYHDDNCYQYKYINFPKVLHSKDAHISNPLCNLDKGKQINIAWPLLYTCIIKSKQFKFF